MKTISIRNIFFFLPLLIPTLLISGPFLPDLILVLTCLYYLLDKNFINFIKDYLKKNDLLIYLGLILIAVLSSILSDYVVASLKSSIFHIRFVLFALVYFYISEKNQKFLDYQIIILGLTLSVLNFDSILQLMTGKNMLGYELVQAFIFRPTSFFFEDLKIGSYLAKFSLLLLALSIYKNKFTEFSIIIVLSSWFVIFFSGERTSFILFTLSLIIIVLFFFKSINKKKIIILFTTFIFLLSLGIYKTSGQKKYIEKMLINPLMETSIIGEGKFLPAHRDHFLVSFEIFKRNLIIGSGANTFRYECKKIIQEKLSQKGCSTHPHNLYIQFLSEVGILGLIIITYFYSKLFIIFFNSFFNLKKNIFNNQIKSHFIVSTLLLISFFPLAPTGNIFNNWYNINTLFALGFFFYLRNNIKNV